MKKIVSSMLAVMLAVPLFGAAAPASAEKPVKASVSESSTYVRGQEWAITGFTINGSNYFSLRDVAEALSGSPSQFDVSYSTEGGSVEILTGRPYTPKTSVYRGYSGRGTGLTAVPSSSKVLVDGKPQSITAYNINGSNYFQLRDLAAKVPFEVEFEPSSNKISLFPKTPEHASRVAGLQVTDDNALTSSFSRWQQPAATTIVPGSDGSLSVVQAGQTLTVEKYSAAFAPAGKTKIPMELPLFGGFFSGTTYNYIAFGQSNEEQNDAKEVIRIVRYDKSFNRIDSVSVTGGQSFTVEPFDAGSGRMAEMGDTLVFHTARKRYKTDDGLNHQSQLTIIVNTASMKVTNDLGRFQANHVSHSFDQYVLFDGAEHVLVDHGDAYPRSIVLNKGNGSDYTEVDLFNIPGKIGANETGVSLGGFEMSAGSYIVAMNSVDHSKVKEYTSFEMVGLKIDQRDIMLAVLPKSNVSAGAARQVTLAKYTDGSKIASVPKLVKITDNRMLVMWQEFDLDGRPGDVKMQYIDGDGNPSDSIQALPGFRLSETQPAVIGGKVVWFTDTWGARVFYSIPAAG